MSLARWRLLDRNHHDEHGLPSDSLPEFTGLCSAARCFCDFNPRDQVRGPGHCPVSTPPAASLTLTAQLARYALELGATEQELSYLRVRPSVVWLNLTVLPAVDPSHLRLLLLVRAAVGQ